tara:strand:- start:631 stop:954 length:324 start_codon:yes stop_codon:yes gene_type:complete
MDELDKLSKEDYIFFDGFKIVVFWWHGGEWNGVANYGDSPEEVVLNMSQGSWIPEENGNPTEYMAGVQYRSFQEHTSLYHDEESFLQLLIKDGVLKIYKWDWEPENK